MKNFYKLFYCIYIFCGVTKSFGYSDPLDGPLYIIRYSDLILHGKVSRIYMERDEHNTLSQLIEVKVKDIIWGECLQTIITLSVQSLRNADIAWKDSQFRTNQEVVLFLLKGNRDLWVPFGGKKWKFTVTNDKIEGGVLHLKDFKRQIKDVAELRANNIVFPLLGDVESGQGISELGGEFTIIDPSLYGPQQGTTIEFHLNPADALDKNGNPISFQVLKTTIERAISTWNNSPHSYATFKTTVSNTLYSGSRNSGDGISTITFEDLRRNGDRGIYAAYYCTVFLGQNTTPPSGGRNSIYENYNPNGWQVSILYGSTSMAEKNWWGSDPPNSSIEDFSFSKGDNLSV